MYLSVLCVLVFSLLLISPLFPYTTLFRSLDGLHIGIDGVEIERHRIDRGDTFDAERAARLAPDGQERADAAGGKVEIAGNDSLDRKSTRLNSSHLGISYAVFCLKKKKKI